jgi:hypothetical protein
VGLEHLKKKKGESTKVKAYIIIFSTGKVKEWPDFYDKTQVLLFTIAVIVNQGTII